MLSSTFEKIAILGASSGLGLALVEELYRRQLCQKVFLSSRKITDQNFPNFQEKEVVVSDFSRPDEQDQLISELNQWAPSQIIYCAGGGPHGKFADKAWKDHQWAFEVSFLFPAKLLRAFMNSEQTKSLVFVGSAIAEQGVNKNSSSYGAAKIALRGLIEAVRAEQPSVDLRLFSPGYMDTRMLPPNAAPRKTEKLINPCEAAKKMWDWLQQGDDEVWNLEMSPPCEENQVKG